MIRTALITAMLVLAPIATKADEIQDGMCTSPIMHVTVDKKDTATATLRACTQSIYDKVFSKSQLKGNIENDIVWWKDTAGTFVVARCNVYKGETLVTIASHHTSRALACPALNVIEKLLNELVVARN